MLFRSTGASIQAFSCDELSSYPSSTGQVSGCILHISISHSHVFLLNSCLDLFSAPHLTGDPFSRGYRVNLPSSLTVSLSSALVYSTRLRVSVWGTGGYRICLADFLGSLITTAIRLPGGSRYCQFRHARRICLPGVYLLPLTCASVGRRVCHFSVSTSLLYPVTESLPFLPSATPFGCALGPDLP